MKTAIRARSTIMLLLGATVIAAACQGEPDVPGAPGSMTPGVDAEPRPVLRDTIRQEQLQLDTIDPPPPAPLD